MINILSDFTVGKLSKRIMMGGTRLQSPNAEKQIAEAKNTSKLKERATIINVFATETSSGIGKAIAEKCLLCGHEVTGIEFCLHSSGIRSISALTPIYMRTNCPKQAE